MLHPRLIRPQRRAAPVRRDVTEEPVLDLVPLAGAGAATHLMPAVANRRHRERRGVVVPAHVHPGLVARHVVDAVRNRLALRVGREIMHQYRRRRALRLPFPPAVLEVSDQFLLLRVDRDHRLPLGQKGVRGRVDVLELRIAVRVARSLLTLAGRLQPVAQVMQQPADGGRTHAPPLSGQRRGQLRPTLAGPAQRRGRVAARQRVHQRFEGGPQTGLALFDTGPPGARTPYPIRRRLALLDFPASVPDRLPGQTRGRRHQRIPAIADDQRLGRRPPAATALIQHGRHRRVLRDDGGFQFHVALHATEIDHKTLKMAS